MAEKTAKVREVTLGNIIVGRMNPEGAFVPGDKQPPSDHNRDFRSVERWLTSEGMTGVHVLVRAYTRNVTVKALTSYTSSLT